MALAVWQAFPLWTGMCQAVLSRVVAVDDDAPEEEAGREKARAGIARFRKIYARPLALAAACHCGVAGYIYLKAESAAGMSPRELLGQVLRPTWPWDAAPVASFEKGVLTLLQWDMYCASLATWCWLAYMAQARAGVGQVVLDLTKAVMWSCVVGPGGAALAVVWGRDVEAIRAAQGKEKSG